MITFDDGYVDIGDEAFPTMREMEIKATIYIPTGLMENFGYLTWAKIDEMRSSGLTTFGNHTWSHKNVGASREAVKYEISTADGQLAEKGLGEPKTFVYPYGIDTTFAEKTLSESGYKLAFTTVRGRILCEKQRLSLPRIRIGSAPLSVFGL
jgi:peptidoglycan/xylan/chitin deacetylase (PgdA/CDA1 family)